TVNFASGVATRSFQVTLIPKPANVHPGNKTVLLSLGVPTGAFPGLPSQAVLTIRDPLIPAKLQLAAAAFSVSESGSAATITVTRTGALAASVSIDYATSDGTAVAGTNYTSASGTVVFAPGQTSQTFTVPVLDDGTATGNVTVNLSLSNPQGDAALGTQTSAVLWIVGAP